MSFVQCCKNVDMHFPLINVQLVIHNRLPSNQVTFVSVTHCLMFQETVRDTASQDKDQGTGILLSQCLTCHRKDILLLVMAL